MRNKSIYALMLHEFSSACEWDEFTLGETSFVLGGGTPNTGDSELWNPPEIPWATPTDITGQKGNTISATSRYISQAGLRQSNLVPANSILMTSRATIGEAKVNTIAMAINQGFAAFVPKPEFDCWYLFYLVQVLRPAFVRVGAGTTFLEASRREIKKISARMPPLEEQRRIAAALKLADDAIAKAKAELDATRALKRTLLRDLFRYGVTQKRDLFRSKWITCPSHWEIKKLRDFAIVKSGFTMGRDLSRQETITVPYVTVINVQDGRFELGQISSIEIRVSELDSHGLRFGDVLMTEGGDRDKLGRGGMWRDEVSPCSYQNHIFRVRLDNEIYQPRLFHHLIQTFQAKNYFFAHAKQTSNLCTINSRELRNWRVAIPPMDEQHDMAASFEAVDAGIVTGGAKVKALEATKKSLLQNLLTGKMRIPEGLIDE